VPTIKNKGLQLFTEDPF